jgi:hypothetical protein
MAYQPFHADTTGSYTFPGLSGVDEYKLIDVEGYSSLVVTVSGYDGVHISSVFFYVSENANPNPATDGFSFDGYVTENGTYNFQATNLDTAFVFDVTARKTVIVNANTNGGPGVTITYTLSRLPAIRLITKVSGTVAVSAVGGTVDIGATFNTSQPTSTASGIVVRNVPTGTQTVDTELDSIQLLDSFAVPTIPRVGSLNYLFNGLSFDRMRGDITNGLDVDVTRLPSIPAGNNNIGDVDIASIAAGDNNIGNVDVVTMPAITGTVTANAGTNLNTSALALETTQSSIKTSVELIDDAVATAGSAITTKGFAIAGTDGTNARIIKTNSSGVLSGTLDSCITIGINESVAAPTAATWYLKRQWAVPSGKFFRPSRTHSVVTTAGSRTMIGTALKLGSFNVSTNVFTDGSAAAAGVFYSRLLAVVQTVLSATPTNITVTYTDQDGNTGHATSALTIPASAPVGNVFEFVLANTAGQMKDVGVTDVTAVVDTAAPTGVVEIWGFNPLLDTFGVANAFEVCSFDNYAITSPENVMIILQQAATTAQQRGATIVGSISAF